MGRVAIGIVVVVGTLPLLFGLADLVEQPGALAEVFGSTRILGLWGNTVVLGLATALVACLVGVPVGRLLARCPGRLTGWVAALLPLPLVLPPWMVGVAWGQWVPLSGLAGAVFLLSVSLWPIVALFALRGFRVAGRAADVAALQRGQRLAAIRVELPLALPSILSGALFVFIFAITDFAVVDYLSFNSAKPFVVLSSEVFQKWSRLDSGAGAAAVSLPAVITSLAALVAILVIEARQVGRFRGSARVAGRPLAASRRALVGLGLLLVTMLVPVVVLSGWALLSDDAGGTLGAARDEIVRSVGVAASAGFLVAVLGVALARQSLRLSRRKQVWLLGLVLAPLAAPAVLFAVGQIRLWNHPANPLADAVYLSPVLLVLALTGRYLPLGVLAARAILLRSEQAPFDAARLVPRPWWQRALRVELPLLAPATSLAFALGYLLSIRELDMVVLIPAGSTTLSHYIFGLVHIAKDDVTAVLCLALVALVLVPLAAARLLGVPGVDCGPSGGSP